LSSNAAVSIPRSGRVVAISFAVTMALAFAAQPVAAQDDAGVTQEAEAGEEPAPAPPPPARPRERLNLSVTVPRNESDRLLEEDCEEEADAARIANEIIVCRQLGEASDGAWNKEDWERRYAERTMGNAQADVAGGGIFRGEATVGGLCVIPPCPPEAAIMIDIEALPEPPPGSDADRIARGLPALGRDPELSPEEIARRRRALGLEAPPVPE